MFNNSDGSDQGLDAFQKYPPREPGPGFALNSATATFVMLKIILICLLIDLISFTSILPLFPRIFQYYLKTDPLMQYIVDSIQATRIKYTTQAVDVVIVGGLVGSMFSVLQFMVSPIIGKLSDVHGRKRVLMWTMVGNLLSQLLWVNATSFKIFLLSR